MVDNIGLLEYNLAGMSGECVLTGCEKTSELNLAEEALEKAGVKYKEIKSDVYRVIDEANLDLEESSLGEEYLIVITGVTGSGKNSIMRRLDKKNMVW